MTMTPYEAQTSGAQKLAAPAAKPVAEAKPVEDAIEEPKKRESKKADVAPSPKRDLDSVLKAWGDEE
jgi:hypothetical protein